MKLKVIESGKTGALVFMGRPYQDARLLPHVGEELRVSNVALMLTVHLPGDARALNLYPGVGYARERPDRVMC